MVRQIYDVWSSWIRKYLLCPRCFYDELKGNITEQELIKLKNLEYMKNLLVEYKKTEISLYRPDEKIYERKKFRNPDLGITARPTFTILKEHSNKKILVPYRIVFSEEKMNEAFRLQLVADALAIIGSKNIRQKYNIQSLEDMYGCILYVDGQEKSVNFNENDKEKVEQVCKEIKKIITYTKNLKHSDQCPKNDDLHFLWYFDSD